MILGSNKKSKGDDLLIQCYPYATGSSVIKFVQKVFPDMRSAETGNPVRITTDDNYYQILLKCSIFFKKISEKSFDTNCN